MSVQTRTTALQNEVVRLYSTFENNGILTNPASQPLVEILDTDGVTVLDTIPAQIEHTGIWYADWYVPANLPLGHYYDRWTFQWSNTAGVTELINLFDVFSLESYINFISPEVSHNVCDRVVQMMKDLSNDFIYEAMHIPVYWEQAMRVQQEDQRKRVKNYYYFTLDANNYTVVSGAVYFLNGQKYTVTESIYPPYSSSSSESSSSSSLESRSTSSSSSIDSVSSASTSSSGSSGSSSISESSRSHSTSSSSEYIPPVTTTTTTWTYQQILSTSGTGVPPATGTLVKVSGYGPSTITYTDVEQKTSRYSTVYSLAYKNWIRDPRPVVRVNNTIKDDGWYVNWNGRIYFDGLMAPEDSVNVYYKFAYFSDEEILSFLNLGLQMMNSTPPASTTYNSLCTMPYEWSAPVLLYGAITALKRLVFGLNFQEQMIIFGDPDVAGQAMSRFQQLYSEYNTLWLEIKKTAKTLKLAGMAEYVTPEYTLPGGRSRWFRYLYKQNA